MVDRNIVSKLGISEETLDQQVNEIFGEQESKYLEELLQKKVDSHQPGVILQGKIVSQIGNDVIVEVGLKSEGVVDACEFDDPADIVPGKEVEVLLEDTDSESGLILLSKRKADVIRGWETILATKKEGDVVTGRVIRRIKGGLLVDIAVPVFLPASQVDIRKPGDISRFIGKEIECKILKIDGENRNIVVSRRKLIEEDRRSSKEKLLAEIAPGQLRKGVVKNIADFGVFVDLGGLDGLLHISDLTWGRITHPSEVVQLDQEIECVVIDVDKENEKISLGLKQKTPSPWEDVEQRYPVGARVRGKVVNIMNYGVFVRLEEGIEGLVHISEMSWTRRVRHPSEMVNLGDEIEVIVLNVIKEKQEISLGMKQTEINPWTIASQKYPPGTIVTAKVRAVANFGAFVEIEPGIEGMIHISDLSWTKRYNHPSEALKKGQEIKCVVLQVDEEKQRISLSIKQMTEDPWTHAIPEKYIPGHIIKGKIVKLTNFGAFVELEPDLEGLLHISELSDHKIKKPQDVVKIGDEVNVKILKVDTESRKIGLSLRRARWAAEEQESRPARQQAASIETGPSSPDTGETAKPQETGEAGEAASAEKVDEAPETKAGDTEQDKVKEESKQAPGEDAKPQETGEAGEAASAEKADEAPETEAGDTEQDKMKEESKQAPGEDAKPQETGEAGEATSAEKVDEAPETKAGDTEQDKMKEESKQAPGEDAKLQETGEAGEAASAEKADEAPETEASDTEQDKMKEESKQAKGKPPQENSDTEYQQTP